MSFYSSILVVSVVVHMVLSSERLCRYDRDMAGGPGCRSALLSLQRAAAARVSRDKLILSWLNSRWGGQQQQILWVALQSKSRCLLLCLFLPLLHNSETLLTKLTTDDNVAPGNTVKTRRAAPRPLAR